MAIYSGSRLFQPFSDQIGIPVDQINFIVCQAIALFLAYVYRNHYSATQSSVALRHALSAGVGVCLGLFCFGTQILHMLVQALGCYALMKFLPGRIMHLSVFTYAMAYLSYMHIRRMLIDYGSYTLDITGPLMISSQKLTCLAFSLHDGMYKDQDSLKYEQRQHSVRSLPSVLVFLSYVFNFQGILVGPLCFFNDYIRFVEGQDMPIDPLTGTRMLAKPERDVFSKLVVSISWMVCALTLGNQYNMENNVDERFIMTASWYYRIYYLMVSCTFSRAKYYFAWKLGEAINNMAGLGFNGLDHTGQQKWDLITNVRIRNIEMAQSFKGLVDNWNIQTATWLKRICYERAPWLGTFLTYCLSAAWHGFYPGYYVTFVSAAFITMAARSVRRSIRPHFLHSPWLKNVYDFMTWFAAHLALAYLVVPHVMLDFNIAIYFYTYSMYWFLHALAVLLLLVLPSKVNQQARVRSSQESVTDPIDAIPGQVARVIKN